MYEQSVRPIIYDPYNTPSLPKIHPIPILPKLTPIKFPVPLVPKFQSRYTTNLNREYIPSSPRKYIMSEHEGIETNPFLDDVLSKRLHEVARTESLEAAASLKKILTNNKLNIVTAESLTAGMIAKTLVDLPGEGACIYGGFIVYDTDAKRQFIGVDTRGVYSVLTAQQMAAGALEKSRAMVAVSVSGDAMPYPENKEVLGNIFIGVALRLSDKILVSGKHISICDINQVKNICDAWKTLNKTATNRLSASYAPFQYTSIIADYIRLKTTAEACKEAKLFIEDAIASSVIWGHLSQEPYDSLCAPSWIIEANISPNIKYVNKCESDDTRSIFA